MKDAIAKREELLEQLDILRQRVDRKGLPSMDFIVIANWYEVPFVE